jgi:uncharacterized radical SAM superfamily Fe-S cluster-containing enzyme
MTPQDIDLSKRKWATYMYKNINEHPPIQTTLLFRLLLDFLEELQHFRSEILAEVRQVLIKLGQLCVTSRALKTDLFSVVRNLFASCGPDSLDSLSKMTNAMGVKHFGQFLQILYQRQQL